MVNIYLQILEEMQKYLKYQVIEPFYNQVMLLTAILLKADQKPLQTLKYMWKLVNKFSTFQSDE